MNKSGKYLVWTVLSVMGAFALGYIALNRGEQINALWIVVASVCIYLIAYRFYGLYIAKNVLAVDPTRMTPAVRHNDGLDYVPTDKKVLFGHHFAAIAGAGPLVGPVLAAQMGYLPGMIWLLAGVVLAGAVQDFMVLFVSTRRDGRSLGELVKEEMGPTAGVIALVACFMIMVIILAVLAMIVVKALTHSPWGTYTVAFTIPLALFMGIYLRYLRPGRIGEVSVIGLVFLIFAIISGGWVAESPTWAPYFDFTGVQLTWMLVGYGFVAAVLPVWLLLAPRDYLSTFLKIGTIVGLAVGILIMRPTLTMPALTKFVDGTGPVWTGNLFPFLFITIACGAISGFHAFIGSGTTPKQIDKWSDILPVGFGAMLAECVVGVMALIAATSLHPADYFAINSSAEAWAGLGMEVVHLPKLSEEIGLDLYGRTGGAVTLAVGMTDIFIRVPWFSNLASYFFQFVIMFEAVFILTAVDSGTRVARYLLQDFLGDLWAPLKRTDWLPGSIFCSIIACALWGYLLNSGDINSVWALFGVSNQLMASVGLIIGATIILRLATKRVYMLTCVIPLAYLFVTVNYAGYWMIKNVYFNSAAKGYNIFNGTISIIMMVLGVIILISALRKWRELWDVRGKELRAEQTTATA